MLKYSVQGIVSFEELKSDECYEFQYMFKIDINKNLIILLNDNLNKMVIFQSIIKILFKYIKQEIKGIVKYLGEKKCGWRWDSDEFEFEYLIYNNVVELSYKLLLVLEF